MVSRTTTSFLHGVGSLIDVGGTTFKRARLRTVRRGDYGTDRRALRQDVKVVISAVEMERSGKKRVTTSNRKVMSARKKGLVG